MAFKFLKTGAASANMAAQAQAEHEARKDQVFKTFRFWVNPKEEARITFVDGDLNDEGFLLPPRWYEHNLKLNGKWGNLYVCPEKTNPESGDKCPICENKDFYAPLVTGFTVIDHRSYVVPDGKNKGKVYKDTLKFLVAGTQSFEILNKLAIKLGGLAGQTFDVSRSTDKVARIGDLFIPISKAPVAELKKLYMREQVDPKTNAKVQVTYFMPLDYEAELVYKTGKELREMGFGTSMATNSTTSSMLPPPQGSKPPVDYSAQL